LRAISGRFFFFAPSNAVTLSETVTRADPMGRTVDTKRRRESASASKPPRAAEQAAEETAPLDVEDEVNIEAKLYLASLIKRDLMDVEGGSSANISLDSRNWCGLLSHSACPSNLQGRILRVLQGGKGAVSLVLDRKARWDLVHQNVTSDRMDVALPGYPSSHVTAHADDESGADYKALERWAKSAIPELAVALFEDEQAHQDAPRTYLHLCVKAVGPCKLNQE